MKLNGPGTERCIDVDEEARWTLYLPPYLGTYLGR